jgi:5-methylcytosine-specific restriction enzyme subunit McrC
MGHFETLKSGDYVNELIEVKEFDSITCNENDKVGPKNLSKKQFDSLVDAVTELENGSNDFSVFDFLEIKRRKSVGRVISFKNYVGLIHLRDGRQIQILPKIDFGREKDETKKKFIEMIRSMRDFQGKVFSDALLHSDRMNVYEIFISLYLQAVRQIVKKGLRSSYLTREDNLNCYKGKLQVDEHIKKNFAHKERFYVMYDEFQQNRPENRLIKATLIKLRMLTTSMNNAREIRQLLAAFDEIEPSRSYEHDFSKVIINRNMQNYKEILQWSKVFLFNKSFTMFSGIFHSKAILFPMEKVFECYVAQELKKLFWGETSWNFETQDKGKYLFTDPETFALRPDIVIRNNTTVVMDTKWKRLFNDPGKNYGIATADMYQMYAYSKRYGAKHIWLLYPKTDVMSENDNKGITFESGPDSGSTETVIHVFFVDIANIKDSLKKLKQEVFDCVKESAP